MDEIKLEGYQITRRIGKGGMGAVYEGVQESLNRRVAIKEILSQFLENKEFRERFKREAQIMAKFNHTNIAQIYELYRDKYIIMEYVEGQPLADIIRQAGKLSELRAIKIIAQVADGLGAAHKKGVVHRDIKPNNIMIAEDDLPKILDFGIARDQESGYTVTGQVIGTLAYMSPEQARGIKSELLNGKSDIYSLGITLYQAITGCFPFQVDTDLDYVQMHKKELPIPPSNFLGTIHPGLEAAILKSLEKEPEKRFATAEEFASELRRVGRLLEESSSQITQIPSGRQGFAPQASLTSAPTDPKGISQVSETGTIIEPPSKVDSAEQRSETGTILEPTDMKAAAQSRADIITSQADGYAPQSHPTKKIQAAVTQKPFLSAKVISIIGIAIVAAIFIIKFSFSTKDPNPAPPTEMPTVTAVEKKNPIIGEKEIAAIDKFLSDVKSTFSDKALGDIEKGEQISQKFDEFLSEHKNIEKFPEGAKVFNAYGEFLMNISLSYSDSDKQTSARNEALKNLKRAKEINNDKDSELTGKIDNNIALCERLLSEKPAE